MIPPVHAWVRIDDVRLPALAVLAWVGCLLGLAVGRAAVVLALLLALLLTVLVLRGRSGGAGGSRPGAALRRWGAVAVAVLAVFSFLAGVRAESARTAVMSSLAEQGRGVDLVGVVASDAKLLRSAFGERSRVEVRVERVQRRDRAWRVSDRVLVLLQGPPDQVRLGQRVALSATPLPPGKGSRHRTAWAARGPVRVQAEPDVWWRAAEAVRASLRGVVSGRPEDQRALVPSLVVGDDHAVPEDLAEAFRTTGLTHLLAVSGTNLTLMLGAVLGLARWCGVRGRWRLVPAALCVVGFVLVARSEPSVVRAATMGSVALLALERNAVERGLRCLALAVLLVLVWDPWMARSVGLTLSVLATAGILVLVPPWSQAMGRWAPRWVALALAVPAAAQLVVTPVVAAVQGEVSLVAVAANVASAPAVAPVTVLGMVAAVCGLVHQGFGSLVAWPAATAAGWIAGVARWGADQPLPAVGWAVGFWPVAGLVLLCLAMVPLVPAVLRRPWLCLPAVGLVVVLVSRGVPVPGWPPDAWFLAACDVGQGDAVVVRTGEESAMVVDVGPDARAVDRCLDRLGVRRVDLLVISHFHADHVDGLEGVLSGREVVAAEVSPVDDPADRAAWARGRLAEAGVEVRRSEVGTTTRVGTARVQRVWPEQRSVTPAHSHLAASRSGGDLANDASVVLLVEVADTKVLLTGDVEPPAQRRLARLLAGVEVDVLKLPHHGSRHQDARFLDGLDPSLVLVSVGAENSYGHPDPGVLGRFVRDGAQVVRTDQSSDVVVVRTPDGLGTAGLG